MATTKRKIEKISNYCLSHKMDLPISEFYKSTNPLYDGYVPFCKKCTQQVFADYYKRFKNLQTATWYTCAQIGIPFIRRTYESMLAKVTGVKNPNFIGVYISILNTQRKSTDRWDSFADTDTPLGEVNTLQDIEAERQSQIKELKMTWGDGLDIDDITFLEWRFTTYTRDMELTEYQASRYRDLCSCELKIKKDEDVQQNMKVKALIAKELGIDQFTNDREKTEADKYIENDIYIMEKYEPAEYYANKELYADFVGIHSYWIKWVLRPIKNLITGSKDYEIDEDSKYGDGNG